MLRSSWHYLRYPQERRHSPWLIWVVSLAFTQFQFILQLSSGVMVTQLIDTFSLDALAAGLLASSYYYIYASLQTPSGMLIDRYGVRRFLTSGSFICASGCVLFAIANNVWIAALARILMGGGAAFAFTGTMYLIRVWFSENRFNSMLGLAETIGLLSTVLATIYLASLIKQLGWRDTMLCASLLGFVISALCWIFIHENPEKNNTTRRNTTFSQRLALILRNPINWLNGLYCGLLFSVITVFGALWAIPFLMRAEGFNLMLATMASTMLFIGASIGTPTLGYLMECRPQSQRILLFGSGAISAILFLILLELPQLSTFTVFLLLFALGFTCSGYILNFGIANRIAHPAAKNTSTGFTNTFSVATAPLLQPLIGGALDFLAKKHGHVGSHTLQDFQIALLIMPVCMLLAALIGLYLPVATTQSTMNDISTSELNACTDD